MLLQLSHFFLPFIPLHPAPSFPLAFPLLSSCPWVIHISSLASPFPILLLTSPCLCCTYHLCFLFPVPFPSFSPAADNPPGDLHFCDSVPVLVVCLVHFCFCFRFGCWWLWVCCHFAVHSFDLLLFLRLSPFNILYTKVLVMMNSFNLTLSGRHFICPSILNDSFAG